MPVMAIHFDICIRGTGIVGRTLALHLAQQRLRVALVAAPVNPKDHYGSAMAQTDVRAYALNQSSRSVVEAVRCWPDDRAATAVRSMQIQGDDGGRVSFSAQDQGAAALNWIVDVPALEEKLCEAVGFQSNIEVFSTPQCAALTIVCEGKASITRQEFGVEFEAIPYDQWALAARVRCTQAHHQTAYQWFDRGEVLAFLPMGGADGNLCGVVWSTTAERTHTLLAMEEPEFCNALTSASHGLAGELTLVSARSAWPLQQAQACRWSGKNAGGAWVLAGDAAHNVHPLAGQGLNLGLADVAQLVQVLGNRPYWRNLGDTALLRQYERARKTDIAAIANTGDALQTLFAHPHPVVQSLRNWGMNGFERSGPIKRWVARRAMGASRLATNTMKP
jgi:2-polyprenyl-6-methoxyphenol hydroxylase-like FAD-dependent oxidoreductase